VADDLPRRVFLEIAHHAGDRLLAQHAEDQVDVVGHQHKDIELDPPTGTQEGQAVGKDLLDRVALEERRAIDGGCGGKV
jgi:hypothetical protein